MATCLLLRVAFLLCILLSLTKQCYSKTHSKEKEHGKYPDSQGAHRITGNWGPWSDWSACSQTCGRGVATQTRECVQDFNRSIRHAASRSRRRSRGRCLGVYRRVQMCTLKPCPQQVDVRKEQCSALNSKPFRGKYYRWEPYLSGPTDCQLACRPVGRNFFLTVSPTVEDGTPCSTIPEEDRVCISGQCKHIGCDGVVGSDKVFDHCGICGGNNSTCRIVSGLYTRPTLPVGYNLIAKIPTGACNINITELRQSKNYLALRTDEGKYVINGNWAINWSGNYEAAGTTFAYQRHDPTSSVGEYISSKGPTRQGVDLLVIYQQPNPGIKYEYTLPIQDAPRSTPSPPRMDNFPRRHSNPHLTAGGSRDGRRVQDDRGIRHFHYNPMVGDSNPKLRHRFFGNSLDPSLHHHRGLAKPPPPHPPPPVPGHISRNPAPFGYQDTSANPHPSWPSGDINLVNGMFRGTEPAKGHYQWRVSGVTECSQTCGEGTQRTIVMCVKHSSLSVVADHHCDVLQKPESQVIRCSTQPCPARWTTEEWGPCSATCGDGTQIRKVFCSQQLSPTLQISLADTACFKLERPLTSRNCRLKACSRWKLGDWGKCSAECGKGVRKRPVSCVTDSGDPSPSSECEGDRPQAEEMCDMGPCANMWFFSEWTDKCPATCGPGTQTRNVVCLLGSGKADPEGTCDPSKKPVAEKPCANNQDCGGKWFTGPWSQCSVTCDNGTQTREVVCMSFSRGQWLSRLDLDCRSEEKPPSTQVCQQSPCRAEWYRTQWSECSKSCGTGVQTREVTCIDQQQRVSQNCPESSRPAIRQACNTTDCPVQHVKKDSGCSDRFRNCNLVVQARLCSYPYYRKMCCDSCHEMR